MDNAIFTVMFLASAPIALMPSAVAFFSGKKHATAILGVNLVIWAGLYFLVRSVVASQSISDLAVPLPLGLLTWLVLLKFAVADGKTRSHEGSTPERAPKELQPVTRDAHESHETR